LLSTFPDIRDLASPYRRPCEYPFNIPASKFIADAYAPRLSVSLTQCEESTAR
jgi:hypothetical protein